jgi:curved DNA-binding protein CbpA
MSFHITQGLFKFDFTDHYAVLGVPLDAEANPIRKRYMQIARRLHPDSCKAESKKDQRLASDLLAKLVSPAYNQLTKERDRTEYAIVLKTMAKRLVQEKDRLKLNTEPAKQLLTAENLDENYKKALQELTAKQYESFSHTLEIIGQISELNLVYLLRKQSSGQSLTKSQPAKPAATPASTPADSSTETKKNSGREFF